LVRSGGGPEGQAPKGHLGRGGLGSKIPSMAHYTYRRGQAPPELIAFTSDHVARLTGLSRRQVRYWDDTGFFEPTLLADHSRKAFGRVYSFRDVVGLRTIGVLRNEHHVPLQELRRVGDWLQREHETPWASLRFGLVGRKVHFNDPKSGQFTEASGRGQRVLPIEIQEIATQMHLAADKLRQRQPAQLGQITRNRYVVHNEPVVSGTRIPTRAVWNFHSAGYSAAAIIREYPRLTKRDIVAAVDFERHRKKAA